LQVTGSQGDKREDGGKDDGSEEHNALQAAGFRPQAFEPQITICKPSMKVRKYLIHNFVGHQGA
jgi:hypothetical protein